MMQENPERALVLAYAPAAERGALAALLALDDALAKLLRTTSEPALGQIRLAWWRDSLLRLDAAAPPAEPVLAGLAADLLPRETKGAELAPLVDGWEELLGTERLDAAALLRFAQGRGALFEIAGKALGAGKDPLTAAGQGWALADLARNLSAPGEAQAARDLAAPLLAQAARARWSRKARALGAMVHLARRDLALPPEVPPPVGSPARLARLMWHGLTGL